MGHGNNDMLILVDVEGPSWLLALGHLDSVHDLDQVGAFLFDRNVLLPLSSLI
jgi:hypothetical protein